MPIEGRFENLSIINGEIKQKDFGRSGLKSFGLSATQRVHFSGLPRTEAGIYPADARGATMILAIAQFVITAGSKEFLPQ